MLRVLRCRRVPGSVLAAGFALLLAGPTLAAEVYRWTTDDGTVAFTDDVKRIPERYRRVAQKISTGSLRNYARYTPDRSATKSSQAALAEEVERLRASNTALEARLAAPDPQATQTASRRDDPFVRVGPQGQPALEVPGDRENSGPLVIEQRRYRMEGGFVTRTDTVVRQGDQVIAIVKPMPHGLDSVNTSDIQDERELEQHP